MTMSTRSRLVAVGAGALLLGGAAAGVYLATRGESPHAVAPARAATSEEDFSIYSNETLLADDHAFVLKIKDTVRAAISEARFAQAVSRMRESTEAMLDTKQLPAIVKLASSSFGITEDESNGVLEHLITGGDFSLYGLANAVTRFSQDVESYDRATKLEEIGYSVMTMSPALFRQMNRTELLAA